MKVATASRWFPCKLAAASITTATTVTATTANEVSSSECSSNNNSSRRRHWGSDDEDTEDERQGHDTTSTIVECAMAMAKRRITATTTATATTEAATRATSWPAAATWPVSELEMAVDAAIEANFLQQQTHKQRSVKCSTITATTTTAIATNTHRDYKLNYNHDVVDRHCCAVETETAPNCAPKRESQLVMPISATFRLGKATTSTPTPTSTSRRATTLSQATIANRKSTNATTTRCRCAQDNNNNSSNNSNKSSSITLSKCQQHSDSDSMCSWSSFGIPAAFVGVVVALAKSTKQAVNQQNQCWLALYVLLMITSLAHCVGKHDGSPSCTFPSRWEGSWFLSGSQQPIKIRGNTFSLRGNCTASDNNKYLIVDEKGCHRCLVIYEKHNNVLQYKESECEGDSMYMHQSNPSALAMHSSIKQTEHRGGAHPNTNGHSRLSSSDQYDMRSNDDMNDCPPDFCKGRETLQNLCDQIPGDALLYSLFRESAEAVKCPLKGPYIFTYNRGHGECKSPVSNINSCTEDSRLLLSFQACPDVQGTESTVEELTCLATWKDGNSRYLVGLVSHHHATSPEERYRCFVYEKMSPLMGGLSSMSTKDGEYKLAQSGDATCNGLDSAEVGSRIMSLRVPPPAERCDFPLWFKGPKHWHGLMNNAVYNYHPADGSLHIINKNGYMETRALCEQINKQTATEMMAVVHYTTGCQSGFMCMAFYRRDTHVIEIQSGEPAVRLEDACAPGHFDVNKTPYITLLSSNTDHITCPKGGAYSLHGAIGHLITRHKRNHNSKTHNTGHGHHHYRADASEGGFGHKRRRAPAGSAAVLSFRDAQDNDKLDWHGSARGLTVRSRRHVSNQLDERPQQPENATESITSTPSSLMVRKENATSSALGTRTRRDLDCVSNHLSQRQLWIGCTEPDIMEVRPLLCNDKGEEEYSCHGSWSENGTIFIIARQKSARHGVCISYKPGEGKSARLTIDDACHRDTQKPSERHLVATISILGECGETSATSSNRRHAASWLLLLPLLLALLKSRR